MTATDVVGIERHGRVAVITLNRPERRNAIHHEMHEPITRALAEFATDDDIGCIVITGAGTAFCAGGDVRGDGDERSRLDPDTRVAALVDDAQVCRHLHEHPKLTIAAVNGPAAGAGMSIALACDFRIAAESSRLVTAWAGLAFSGDYGGAWFLTRLVGPSRALELLATNASIGAIEAHELGLVNRVVDDVGFSDAWMAWARELADGPTFAISGMKANVHDALYLPLSEALARESERQVATARSDAHRQARQAWLAARSQNR